MPLAVSAAAADPDLSRYLAVTGLLVLAIAALAFGFRRLVAGAWRQRAARRSLAVVDVLPLGGKRRLSVVRCYDRTFLLGLGEREVTLIAELDAAAVAPEGLPAGAAPDADGFERLLEAAHARLGERGATRSGGEAGRPRLEELVA
jgi:flagellar biogenesis protein FliO